MVLNKISNLSQLKLEILRLQSIRTQQELMVKDSFQEVNESLKPGNLAKNILSSFFADKKETENFLMYGINKGINYGINYLAEKVFLKDKPGIVKTMGHFLINNVISKMVSGSSFFSGIKNLFQNIKSDENGASSREVL